MVVVVGLIALRGRPSRTNMAVSQNDRRCIL